MKERLVLYLNFLYLCIVNESRSGDTPRTQSERARNENSPQRPREYFSTRIRTATPQTPYFTGETQKLNQQPKTFTINLNH